MSSSGEIPESDVPANGASWEADDSNVPSPAGPENDEAAPEPAEPRENEPEPSLPDKNVTDAAEPEIRGENPKENEVEAKPVEPAARRALVDAVVRLSFRTGPGGGRDGANENGKLQDDDETNLNGHVADGEVRRAPPKEVKSTLVRVSQGELLSETAKRILWENEDIPQSLQHCLEVELASVSCRNQSRKRPREREAPPPELSPIQMQIALQNLVDAYAKGYLAYNEALLRVGFFAIYRAAAL